jgi:hypothetical protein
MANLSPIIAVGHSLFILGSIDKKHASRGAHSAGKEPYSIEFQLMVLCPLPGNSIVFHLTIFLSLEYIEHKMRTRSILERFTRQQVKKTL